MRGHHIELPVRAMFNYANFYSDVHVISMISLVAVPKGRLALQKHYCFRAVFIAQRVAGRPLHQSISFCTCPNFMPGVPMQIVSIVTVMGVMPMKLKQSIKNLDM